MAAMSGDTPPQAKASGAPQSGAAQPAAPSQVSDFCEGVPGPLTEDTAENTPLPPKPPPPYYAADCLNAPTPTNTDTTPPPWQLPPKHPPLNSPPPKEPSSSGAAQPAPSKRPSSSGVAQPSAPPEHRDAHNTITHTVALAPNKAKTKPGAKWMPPKRPPATPPPARVSDALL